MLCIHTYVSGELIVQFLLYGLTGWLFSGQEREYLLGGCAQQDKNTGTVLSGNSYSTTVTLEHAVYYVHLAIS